MLDLAIPHARSSAADRVSLSIGVASLQPTFDAAQSVPGASDQSGATGPSGFELSRELFERADQALYTAKSGGRNQVAMVDGECTLETAGEAWTLAPVAAATTSRASAVVNMDRST